MMSHILFLHVFQAHESSLQTFLHHLKAFYLSHPFQIKQHTLHFSQLAAWSCDIGYFSDFIPQAPCDIIVM